MIKRILFDEYGRVLEIEFWEPVTGVKAAEEINQLQSHLHRPRPERENAKGGALPEAEIKRK